MSAKTPAKGPPGARKRQAKVVVPSRPESSAAKVRTGKKRGPKPRLTEQQTAEAVERRIGGESFEKIAQTFGVSRDTVRVRVRESLESAAEVEFKGHAAMLVLRAERRIEHVIQAHWATATDPQSARVILEAVRQLSELFDLATYAARIVAPAGEAPERLRPIIQIFEAAPPPQKGAS